MWKNIDKKRKFWLSLARSLARGVAPLARWQGTRTRAHDASLLLAYIEGHLSPEKILTAIDHQVGRYLGRSSPSWTAPSAYSGSSWYRIRLSTAVFRPKSFPSASYTISPCPGAPYQLPCRKDTTHVPMHRKFLPHRDGQEQLLRTWREYCPQVAHNCVRTTPRVNEFVIWRYRFK